MDIPKDLKDMIWPEEPELEYKGEVAAKLVPKEYVIEHDGDPELYFYLRRNGELWNIYIGSIIAEPFPDYGTKFKTEEEAMEAFKFGFSNSNCYKKYKV